MTRQFRILALGEILYQLVVPLQVCLVVLPVPRFRVLCSVEVRLHSFNHGENLLLECNVNKVLAGLVFIPLDLGILLFEFGRLLLHEAYDGVVLPHLEDFLGLAFIVKGLPLVEAAVPLGKVSVNDRRVQLGVTLVIFRCLPHCQARHRQG